MLAAQPPTVCVDALLVWLCVVPVYVCRHYESVDANTFAGWAVDFLKVISLCVWGGGGGGGNPIWVWAQA